VKGWLTYLRKLCENGYLTNLLIRVVGNIGHDQKLYKLLLMQIKRCTANLVCVPSEGYITPQMISCITAPTFLKMDIEDEKRFDKLRHELESDTGVNIYYYHRIKSIAAKRPRHRRSSI
jgi:hypothetical protein